METDWTFGDLVLRIFLGGLILTVVGMTAQRISEWLRDRGIYIGDDDE